MLDINTISLRPISRALATTLIEKHHYSKILPPTISKYCLGVFQTADDTHEFFTFHDELVGVIVYGKPPGIHVAKSVSPLLDADNVLELVRLWIHDKVGKNAESRVIALSFEWLRNNAPHIKALVSYADPSAGHTGTIYQATNWLYQGCGTMTVTQYLVKTGELEPWIHSRTCKELYDTTALTPRALYDRLGHGFWRKPQSRKHRYIYVLVRGRERKHILKSLKHDLLAYPKYHSAEQLEPEWIDYNACSTTQ